MSVTPPRSGGPLPGIPPVARLVIAFVGVIVGVVLIFAGIGSFEEDAPAPEDLIVPAGPAPLPQAPPGQGAN